MRGLQELSRQAFLVAMLAGTVAITAASLVYFEPNRVAPFVLERLGDVRFPALFRASLKLHVVCALLSFPLCLLLMTRWIQRRPQFHRPVGRVTGLLVLLGLVPSGMLLAFEATGGLVVSAGFWLSGAIIGSAMVRGVRAARKRDVVSHAHAMRHVMAQMSVAVTSRAMLIGFDAAGVNPEIAYVVALWVPVLGSAACVEALSRPFALSFGAILKPSVPSTQRSLNALK